MDGSLFPGLDDSNSAQILHRWIAVLVGLIVAAVVVAAWRQRPRTRSIVWLAGLTAALFPIQALIGGLQILTNLSGWTQTLHLTLGAVIWSLLVALVERRVSRGAIRRVGAGGRARRAGDRRRSRPRSRRRRGAGCPDAEGHHPRLHRAHEAPDHRAPPRHHRPGHGPRDARGAGHPGRPLAVADRLDADRRDARRGQCQRDQLLSRSRHRPADGPHPAPALARPRGRPRAGGRVRARPRRDRVRRPRLLRQPAGGVPRRCSRSRSTSSSTRCC